MVIKYSYEINTEGDHVMIVYSDTTVVCFILSENTEKGLPEHSLMIADFEDKVKRERFVELLALDASTAYTIYLETR